MKSIQLIDFRTYMIPNIRDIVMIPLFLYLPKHLADCLTYNQTSFAAVFSMMYHLRSAGYPECFHIVCCFLDANTVSQLITAF